jgi:hypothetical protein
MALKLSTISDGKIEVIARIDSAIPSDLPTEKYDEYLQTLDESLLQIPDDQKPTKFVMRKVLPWAIAQKVSNMKAYVEKGEVKLQLSWMAYEVKYSLIDIINPEDLSEEDKIIFEKSTEGGAKESLMEKLVAAGIVEDLFNAKQNILRKSSNSKKS